MAFRAAMTGHQVYSTLHTNSAIGSIPRLQDLGVLPDILAGNIIGVIAQRLLRKLCLTCREPYRPDDEMTRRILGVDNMWHGEIYRSVGCAECDNTGYRGRMAIMEIFKMNQDIDELIALRSTGREIREAARKTGYRTLAEDAVARILAGLTDIDEVSRVVDLTDRVS